jgi:hypothetical protein
MVVRLAIPQNFAEKYWQSIIINYVDLFGFSFDPNIY